jgi:hypothetical protein
VSWQPPRPLFLCPVCLRKLHHAVGVDPAERYRRLAEFYARHGLPADAAVAAEHARRAAGP